jgi:hypothetical protein
VLEQEQKESTSEAEQQKQTQQRRSDGGIGVCVVRDAVELRCAHRCVAVCHVVYLTRRSVLTRLARTAVLQTCAQPLLDIAYCPGCFVLRALCCALFSY